MQLQSKNLNKVRVVTICYIEILLQLVFIIWFLYPALYRERNNIYAQVDSIQYYLGWFDSIVNQLTVGSYTLTEIRNRNKIYYTTHQLTRLDNIYSYLMIILKSINITCLFNNIISIFWIFVYCRYCTVIYVTYLSVNV